MAFAQLLPTDGWKHQTIESSTCFGGRQIRYRHDSETLNCTMSFGVYLPPAAEKNKVPFLIWLSGLTGRDNTFHFWQVPSAMPLNAA